MYVGYNGVIPSFYFVLYLRKLKITGLTTDLKLAHQINLLFVNSQLKCKVTRESMMSIKHIDFHSVLLT